MIANTMYFWPAAVFVVGSGIDVPLIKPVLEAATTLPVTAPEEPETALARGAALASANAPLFVSSTAAQAYAQDPGTGAIDPFAIAPGYFDVPHSGDGALAYSAVPDDFAEPYTGMHTAATELIAGDYRERRSFGRRRIAGQTWEARPRDVARGCCLATITFPCNRF